jgi:hypothetical protein
MPIDTPHRGWTSTWNLTVLGFCLALATLAGCDPNRFFFGPDDDPGREDLKVLFIGNSLTYWNDMPLHLENLLETGGTPAYVVDVSRAGMPLANHLQITATRKAVSEQEWDIIVLQDASYEIAVPALREPVYDCFRTWRDFIRVENPGAWIVVFLDYALDTDIQIGETVYSREQFQTLLRTGYLAVADSLDLSLAPVGWAWNRVMLERPDIELYDEDEVHPSLRGQYLQACVYYTTITGRSPEGLGYRASLPIGTVNYLQRVAGETVRDERSTWHLPTAVRR